MVENMTEGVEGKGRAPHTRPPFTLRQLKKAIPPHCFRRSALRSLSYVAVDLSGYLALCYISTTYFSLLPRPAAYVAWPIVWVAKGVLLTGYWVIAHDCGHHGFSEYEWLDDAVGFFIHSSMLVPYFSWKYSHRIHHSNTASLDRDEGIVPVLKSTIPRAFRYVDNSPARVVLVLFISLASWPAYFLFNAWGNSYGRWTSHYDPYSPLYRDSQRVQVVISDLGVPGVLYAIARLVAWKGLAWMLCVYFAPLVVTNACMAMIVLLNHTDPSLPRYDSSNWDWLKGAMSTVDRDYGALLNAVFNHVTDGHVVHHLFSSMPHYHTVEATKAIKPLMGEYYTFDSTPCLKALWIAARDCACVVPDGRPENKGVYWFSRISTHT